MLIMNANLFRQLQNCLKASATNLSTLSPLAVTFNSRPGARVDIRLAKHNVGLFNVPELTSPTGFRALQERCAVQVEQLVNEAVSKHRNRKMVEVFDELSNTLCKVADLAEFIRIAHPMETYARAAEEACATVSGIVETLNTNKDLYLALKNVVQNGDKLPTDKIDQHLANLFLFDFEQCGIHLPDVERQKVVRLNEAILQFGQAFAARCNEPRRISQACIPDGLKHAFMNDGDHVVVSDLCGDSSNPHLRELAYKAYFLKDERQEYLLMRLLEARNDLANACGFSTYAERALRGSTFENPSVVKDFLDTLSEKLRPYAETDFDVMNKMKAKGTARFGPLACWDVPYFTHKAKREWFQYTVSDFAPYLSIGACMEGLNVIFTNLYGIKMEHVDVAEGEIWSPYVYKLAVTHESEGLLGYMYCDLYEREMKPHQDCHFTIRGGKTLSDGSYQMPLVVLLLNLPFPRWSTPSLLTPSMMDNLFHEMGHAMHSMLARTKYQHVTGTRCSTDLAEVPSILMEYFAGDPRVVGMFTRHFQTKEKMPTDMVMKMCMAKRLFTACEMQVQTFYAALDQVYHGEHPLKGSTTDVLAETQSKYYSLPYVANTSWQLRFCHLVGYGAKYYSYTASRGIATLIWQTYFEADPWSRVQGERYRKECLAHGGGKPPRQLVRDFLQQEPTPEVLAASLVREIAANQSETKQAVSNV